MYRRHGRQRKELDGVTIGSVVSSVVVLNGTVG
jgi:hypothetical protein